MYNKEKKLCDWPANVNCGSPDPDLPGNGTTTTTTPGPPPEHGPSPRFAPYYDVMLKDVPTLSQIYAKTGQKDFTLAFVLGSSAGCDPKWGAERDLDDKEILDEIRAVQEKGGQMIVALGGAGENEERSEN